MTQTPQERLFGLLCRVLPDSDRALLAEIAHDSWRDGNGVLTMVDVVEAVQRAAREPVLPVDEADTALVEGFMAEMHADGQTRRLAPCCACGGDGAGCACCGGRGTV